MPVTVMQRLTSWIHLPFITDIDECAVENTNDCVDGATCKNTFGNFFCICPSGFIGDGRESPQTGCTGMKKS